MNNEWKTFEEELQDVKEIIDVFHKELDMAYEKIASGEHDIQKWHEKLLETLSNCFWISSDQLGKKGYCIDPDRVDQIIKENASRRECIVSKEPCDDEKVQAKWILRKRIKGEVSELEIELKADNYIEFWCSDGWSMTVFGYDSLDNGILCWAEGDM